MPHLCLVEDGKDSRSGNGTTNLLRSNGGITALVTDFLGQFFDLVFFFKPATHMYTALQGKDRLSAAGQRCRDPEQILSTDFKDLHVL